MWFEFTMSYPIWFEVSVTIEPIAIAAVVFLAGLATLAYIIKE